MRLRGFIFTETAKADLASLREYLLKEAGPQVARKQTANISKCIRRLKNYPQSAPVVITGQNEVRQSVVGRYLVYSTANADRLAIISIRHSAQDRDFDSLAKLASNV